MAKSKKKKRELSSYDKNILFSVRISNVLFVFYTLLNLFCPTYSDSSMGYIKVFSYLSIIFMFIGVLGVHGYFNQIVPMLPVALVRVFQFVLCNVTKKLIDTNVIVFIILCLVDMAFCIFFFTDRANYEYIEVKSEEDE